jgi:hypothetical protein
LILYGVWGDLIEITVADAPRKNQWALIAAADVHVARAHFSQLVRLSPQLITIESRVPSEDLAFSIHIHWFH